MLLLFYEYHFGAILQAKCLKLHPMMLSALFLLSLFPVNHLLMNFLSQKYFYFNKVLFILQG